MKLPLDPFKASSRAADRMDLDPCARRADRSRLLRFLQRLFEPAAIVGFSSEGWKDSAFFANESGEFVVNLATHHLQGPINETSAPFDRSDDELPAPG